MDDLIELVKFAKEHHPSICNFTDEQVKNFFVQYASTTIIRQDKQGNITGFGVWDDRGDTIRFLAAGLTGSYWDNFRTIRQFLRTFAGKSINIR